MTWDGKNNRGIIYTVYHLAFLQQTRQQGTEMENIKRHVNWLLFKNVLSTGKLVIVAGGMHSNTKITRKIYLSMKLNNEQYASPQLVWSSQQVKAVCIDCLKLSPFTDIYQI